MEQAPLAALSRGSAQGGWELERRREGAHFQKPNEVRLFRQENLERFFFSPSCNTHTMNEVSEEKEEGGGAGENRSRATRIEQCKRATSYLLRAPISGLMAADNGCNEDEPFH